MTLRYSTDIVIFGGGVAGLWLLNRLRQSGYQAILLERESLGGGQTLASQGIIHGGLKYALSGALTGASQAIADMPARWRAALKGDGEIDLTAVRVLSDNYYMWSNAGVASKLKTFFGSKSLRGRIEAVSPADYPVLFKAASVAGNLYRLPDFVVDTPSLLQQLANPHADHLFAYNGPTPQFTSEPDGRLQQLTLQAGDTTLELAARQFVLAAGEGNADLLTAAGVDTARTQTRPLHMVYVKQRDLPAAYVHCIGADFSMKPALTVTSHPDDHGMMTWYLGGDLAETGVGRSADEQIQAARETMKKLFPWIDLQSAQWGCFPINRAEIAYDNNNRPDDASMLVKHNLIATWPTKLTLAPVLADKVLAQLQAAGVQPAVDNTVLADLRQILPLPELGQSRWEANV